MGAVEGLSCHHRSSFTVILIFTWNGPVSLLAFAASVSSTFVY